MNNLLIDLLNRIIESKINIYDDISYNDKDCILYDFLEKNKYSVDYKLIYLILNNKDIVYKYICNELEIQYKLILLEKSKFNISNRVIKLNSDYYTFNEKEKEKLEEIKNEAFKIISGDTNLSYNILYLLQFKNGIHYKFGISNHLNLNRLKNLSNVYEIDFNKSIIYYGLKRDIRLIESYIKKIIPEIYNNPYQEKTGFTEVRHMESFDKVFQKLENQFSKDFSLIKYELKKLNKNWNKNIKITKPVELEIELPDFNIDIPEIDTFDYNE